MPERKRAEPTGRPRCHPREGVLDHGGPVGIHAESSGAIEVGVRPGFAGEAALGGDRLVALRVVQVGEQRRVRFAAQPGHGFDGRRHDGRVGPFSFFDRVQRQIEARLLHVVHHGEAKFLLCHLRRGGQHDPLAQQGPRGVGETMLAHGPGRPTISLLGILTFVHETGQTGPRLVGASGGQALALRDEPPIEPRIPPAGRSARIGDTVPVPTRAAPPHAGRRT